MTDQVVELADRQGNECKLQPPSTSGTGEHILEHISRNCDQCGRCLGGCAFLQCHGTPGGIAGRYLAGAAGLLRAAFSCSLCGWCEQVCPQGLPMAAMFLELRRQAVREGRGRFKGHLPLLGYEALGGSPLLTGYFLPAGCTTVLFPGCALPGLRPRQTYRLFRLLRERIPGLGLVLDCCGKPSHDLGREDRFRAKFFKIEKVLRDRGVQKIIIACPSCLQVFRKYGEDLEVEAVFTSLGEHEFGRRENPGPGYTLHDPCIVRFDYELHRAVRRLMAAMGLVVIEMAHNGATTFCCGKGGAAIWPEGGGRGWRQKRLTEAAGLKLVTYCAGCTSALAAGDAFHLLDLLLTPAGSGEKPPKAVTPPFTYANRLWLKLIMKASFLFEYCENLIPARKSRKKPVTGSGIEKTCL